MTAVLTHWATWMHLSMSILGLLLYVASTHALQQRRHPSSALSWILSFFFVPYLALPAYVFFGQRKIDPARRPPARPPLPAPAGARSHWISSMLQTLGAPPSRADEGLQIHEDAAAAEASLWALLDSARHRLYVSTYLLGDDRVGRQLITRLAARASAGVDVRLLLDGVGCIGVRRYRLAPLLRAGGKVARAFPPLRRLLHRQSNFRNHRKLVVADSARLWMGGRNFADEYFAGAPGKPGWPDLSLEAQGAIAADADAVFRADWKLATDQDIGTLPGDAASHPEGRQLQLLATGPDQPQDALQALLVTSCFRAQNRICMVTPYLIPDTALLQALILAAGRQVRVDIVIPARSNHLLADQARRRAMRELALAGVSIWLAPQMIHAKAVVFDDVALCGSANVDIRSLFLNFELSMVLYERHHAQTLADRIDMLRAGASLYRPAPVSMMRDLYEGAVLWIGFQL